MIPHALNGLTYVERLYCHAESDATNEVAKKVKETPSKGFYVIQADIITSGYEKLIDTRGGLWVSFVITTDEKRSDLFCKYAATIAAQEVISKCIEDKSISIRWPGEILCIDKMIGKITIEPISPESKVFVIQMGLLINVFPDQIKSGFEQHVTTLLAETGNCQTIGTLLRMIVECFHENLQSPMNLLVHRYNEHLYGRGMLACIDGKSGTVDHINDDGSICIVHNGKCLEIASGELVLESRSLNG